MIQLHSFFYKFWILNCFNIVIAIFICLLSPYAIGAEETSKEHEFGIKDEYKDIVKIKDNNVPGIVEEMTDAELAGQMMILHLARSKQKKADLDLSDVDLIERIQPGGIILYAENIHSPEKTRNMITLIQSKLKKPAFIAIDEEGGRVSRLQRAPEMRATRIPPARMISESGSSAVWFAYLVIGRELASLGITMNFAPVADLGYFTDSDIVGDRALGSTLEQISKNCAIAVKALRASNILAVVKHFPGHGRSTGDSHFEVEEISTPWAELLKEDVKPFISSFDAGADAVMTAHIWYSGVDRNKVPVSMSRVLMNDKLRDELGFNGLIITDALDMQGVLGYDNSWNAGIKSLIAGADMLLCPLSPDKQKEEIIRALKDGRLQRKTLEEKVGRILGIKAQYGITGAINNEKKAITENVTKKTNVTNAEDIMGSSLHKYISLRFLGIKSRNQSW